MKLKQLAMAYHLCPLKGYEWNLERLAQYSEVFNGPKVVGIATLTKVKTEKVVDEVKGFLGEDVIIKKVPNNPIARESATFHTIMRQLELKVDRSKTALWYGHSKGITHTKSPKYKDTTKLWASACYYYTLSPEYLEKALSFLGQGYSIVGPFRRLTYQKNFPLQMDNFHFSGTFFWLNARDFFSSNWRKGIDPNHRYSIEALPGTLFPAYKSQCTFGDKASDLYKDTVWKKILKPELVSQLLK